MSMQSLMNQAQEELRAQDARRAEQGMGEELRRLMVEYCGIGVAWQELAEVQWGGLAQRLGCRAEWLAEAAEAMDSEERPIWPEVLRYRIKRAATSRVFRDGKWEGLESQALEALAKLMDRNAIRDPGELLAVASAARRAIPSPTQPSQPQGGTTVNVNLGVPGQDVAGLPAAGAKMTIDLSPRTAQMLQAQRERVAPKGQRVIDGEMLSAKELRAILEQPKEVAESPTENSLDEGEKEIEG